MFDLTKEGSNLSEKLCHIFESAAAGSVIRLPSKEIELPNVTIRRPMKIQGQPGTILHFKASKLIIDLADIGGSE